MTLELRPKNIFVSLAKAGLGEGEKTFRKEAEAQVKGQEGRKWGAWREYSSMCEMNWWFSVDGVQGRRIERRGSTPHIPQGLEVGQVTSGVFPNYFFSHFPLKVDLLKV